MRPPGALELPADQTGRRSGEMSDIDPKNTQHPEVHGGPLRDDELLARIARGNDEACNILVRRHIRAATLFASQLMGNRDDAEDIVQSAFILASQRAAEFEAGRPFAPWLFAVVRRLAFKAHERRAHRQHLWRRWWNEASSSVDPSGQLDVASDVAVVRREMAALPPMQRVCFELVVLRDVAVEDVAAMYEIAASTVRQHVFRARRELRSRLESLLGTTADRWGSRGGGDQ
jgi:RNA polymerase sigma-70 factor, ECF subfamily